MPSAKMWFSSALRCCFTSLQDVVAGRVTRLQVECCVSSDCGKLCSMSKNVTDHRSIDLWHGAANHEAFPDEADVICTPGRVTIGHVHRAFACT